MNRGACTGILTGGMMPPIIVKTAYRMCGTAWKKPRPPFSSGSQINRETAEMKKTNPLYVLAWYVPPILLISALFMFLVRVDASERFLDFLDPAACAFDRGHAICVPILMKKRMEKRAAVFWRRTSPTSTTNLHPTTVCSIWIPRAVMSVSCGRTTPSVCKWPIRPDRGIPHQQRPAAGAPPW